MRSRYSAYALGNADYIIRTTHPENPHYSTDFTTWKKNILHFSHTTQFTDLAINEFIDGDTDAFVTFTAYLSQGGKDVSFTEKSRFLKVDGKWLYHDGQKIPLSP